MIGHVELLRVIRRYEPTAEPRARWLLSRVAQLALDDAILEAAATLEPTTIRSLDAIHLATALALGEDLEAIVTYDARMAEAARTAALPVEAPQ